MLGDCSFRAAASGTPACAAAALRKACRSRRHGNLINDNTAPEVSSCYIKDVFPASETEHFSEAVAINTVTLALVICGELRIRHWRDLELHCSRQNLVSGIRDGARLCVPCGAAAAGVGSRTAGGRCALLVEDAPPVLPPLSCATSHITCLISHVHNGHHM